MRTLICFLLLGSRLLAADFIVHEWGTFTSVVGSDGRMLTGLEVEEEPLPFFVRGLEGFGLGKGINRPVKGVTVKMETPVLYFYSDVPRSVRIEVGFNRGAISQWYPDRLGGETLPPGLATVDFSVRRHGSATWQVDVLAPRTVEKITARPVGTVTLQWPRARVPGANLVRGPGNEVEGFIFYRGLGNFALPLAVTVAPDGSLVLGNQGVDPMPFVWVYEQSVRAGDPVRSWFGPLAAGARHAVPPPIAGAASTKVPFHDALVRAGLAPGEAAALIATWRESYFDRPGLRVFWIVPRTFADGVLPIAIAPRPDKIERVLVGRTEVLTPAFEAELVRDFMADGGKPRLGDRYYRAYRERAAQLGVTVGVAPVPRRP